MWYIDQKTSLIKLAKSVGLSAIKAREDGESRSLAYHVMNKLIFKKVKGALGLSKCKLFMTGAAPISDKTLDLNINQTTNFISYRYSS